MNEKLTIKQIAELSGVSSATVSKVLNNTGRYSEDTKQKVLDIVKKYDYRPNAIAKSLRTSKSKTIGVIVPDITNEFFAQIVLAIEKICGIHGYSVFICNSNENEEKEVQYFKELDLRGVDGLIYLSGSDQLFETHTNIPIVCIDRKPKSHNVKIITSDNFTGGYIAGEELVKKGCKNLLLIRDFRDVFPTVERIKGFTKALDENKIGFETITVEVGIESGQQAIEELFNKDLFSFDGIFATTDGLAFGAYLALRNHQVNVPEEVKIIGFDDISLAKYTSMSSINQDKESLGKLAANELINMIENKKGKVNQNEIIKVPIKLVKRNSTGD